MSSSVSRRSRAGRILVASVFCALTLSAADKPPKLGKEKVPQVDETIGSVAFVRANDTIRVQGVGLVIGLNDTGSDPQPSIYRSRLLERMRKAQVPNAEQWLESLTTSLVLVHGTIPAGVTPKDTFDIQVSLPPASTTTSLAGGYLLMTPLSVQQTVEEGSLEGQVLAEAHGPIMIGSDAQPDDPKVGRILGGARAKKEMPYTLILKEKRQGYQTAALVQRVINLRFHQRKGTDQVGMANARTPEYLVLNVPRVYHHNQYRYFQVVERLPLIDTPALREQRLAQWSKELLDPKTSGQTALKLEGLGRNAIDVLKTGLASPNFQVRFFAAEALAYLNDPSGVDVLAQAAREHPDFRAFALAALAAMDQPASVLRLRDLMALPDPDVRYGAFNALRTIDPYDPALGRVRVMKDPPQEEPTEDDPTALAIRSVPRRRTPRPDDPFELYVVDCDGPPMIHVARTRRCEIVLFGRGQTLLTPAVLGGSGSLLVNAADGDPHAQISRVSVKDLDGPEAKVTSPLALGSIIQELANLGATYPEVLGLLQAAERQRNLPGPLVVDAVPAPRPNYEAAQLAGVDATTAKKDEAVGRASLEKGEPDAEATPRFGLFRRLRERISR